MDLKLDDTLKSLIDLGKRSGYLTWDQVNAQIPPDTVEPERLDQILELLDQHGISIIEEDQADDRAARTLAGTYHSLWRGRGPRLCHAGRRCFPQGYRGLIEDTPPASRGSPGAGSGWRGRCRRRVRR